MDGMQYPKKRPGRQDTQTLIISIKLLLSYNGSGWHTIRYFKFKSISGSKDLACTPCDLTWLTYIFNCRHNQNNKCMLVKTSYKHLVQIQMFPFKIQILEKCIDLYTWLFLPLSDPKLLGPANIPNATDVPTSLHASITPALCCCPKKCKLVAMKRTLNKYDRLCMFTKHTSDHLKVWSFLYIGECNHVNFVWHNQL
jgi:hypothetical protein